MKKHIRDIRLYNNAGMSFPVCQTGAKLLDVDKSAWPTGGARETTCKHCMKKFRTRYAWAMTADVEEYFEKHLNEN